MLNQLKKFIKPIYLIFIRVIWRLRNRHNSTTLNSVHISKVTVGKFTYGEINLLHVYGSENEKLSIGSFCSIGPDVKFILGGEHHYDYFSTFPLKVKVLNLKSEAYSKGEIRVEDDVWIGHGALIMSGVTIGRGSVVGAGSVVVKDVEPYSIIGGNPAKLIKYRFSQEIIDKLMKVDYGKLNLDNLNISNVEVFYKKIDDNLISEIIEKWTNNDEK